MEARTEVIGVEADVSCAFQTSVRAGRLVEIVPGATLADGLGGNLTPKRSPSPSSSGSSIASSPSARTTCQPRSPASWQQNISWPKARAPPGPRHWSGNASMYAAATLR